jgi:stage II sporulation protein AA (anti-sigma F factor antagonist)
MEQIFVISGTTLIIHLPPELDHHSSERIRLEADRIISCKNIRQLLFDFAQTVFMDSSGIGMIIGRYKMMRFAGGSVLAVRVNAQIRKVLTLSGIYKVIDIYEGMPQQIVTGGENHAAK